MDKNAKLFFKVMPGQADALRIVTGRNKAQL
jgi:hypothetical protein